MINGIGNGLEQLQLIGQKIKAADTDGKEGLSKDEILALSESLKADGKAISPFMNKLLENFDKLDKNSDGQLSKDDLLAMKSQGGGFHGINLKSIIKEAGEMAGETALSSLVPQKYKAIISNLSALKN